MKKKRSKILLGAHMSIAGGIYKSVLRGNETGCNTIQIFTKNTNRWASKPISEDQAGKFIQFSRKLNINPIFAHTSYLINLASPDKENLRKSKESFFDEIERCELLNIPYLVMHPGSTIGKDIKTGIDRIADSLNEIVSRREKINVIVCIETTAGQGSCVGYKFEHIAEIIEKTNFNIGVCLDTCHIFAAGYDIRSEESYIKTFKEFDDIIGMEKLRIIHLNDSKKEFGSKVDRHEHIGKGYIGIKAFELIMNDRKLIKVPKILETPKGEDMKEDVKNMALLKSLLK